MGNSLSKIFAIILAVLLLFYYPLLNMFEQQDNMTKIFVFSETTKFVDSVRNTGFISREMLNGFNTRLMATNNVYEIKLEHRHKKCDPIYLDPIDENSFQDDFNLNYDTYYTDEILECMDSDTKYYFSEGDFFTISVVNKNKTVSTKIKQMLYGTGLATENIIVHYGGMVKNEVY